MNVLGIETSCDETATSVISARINPGLLLKQARRPSLVKIDEKKCVLSNQSISEIRVLSNIISSQTQIHQDYGGVVPEIAARAHIKQIDLLVKKALKKADLSLKEIDLIAATAGPGLIGGLITGLMTAKAISMAQSKPFIGVNHLEGHALSVLLESEVNFPYLLLLVSGGHTQSMIVHTPGHYQRLGSSVDDAAGEAFDKAAKILGLGFPGGPALEKAALKGNATRFKLPRPYYNAGHANFSFSGLKTAIQRTSDSLRTSENTDLKDQDVFDLAACAQSAIIDCLVERSQKAMHLFQAFYAHYQNQETNLEINQTHLNQYTLPISNPVLSPKNQSPCFIIAGGVASNQILRHQLKLKAETEGFQFLAPSSIYCTDNAAMIALAGMIQYLIKGESSFDIEARARWPLDQESAKIAPIIGHGRKGPKA